MTASNIPPLPSQSLRAVKRGGIGVVAQLVERFVRNEKVAGSIPASSTSFLVSFFSFFRMPMLTSSPRLKPGDSSHPDDGRGSGL